MPFQFILTETRGSVGVITLNRPDARNALNNLIVHELMQALQIYDADPAVGAMVIAGSENAFAAGADIKEMARQSLPDMKASNFIPAFGNMMTIAKPIVAAVSGWALGGGCEVALACDLIVASDTAKFGQPEVTIGVIPGAGGTQRLTLAVGKSIAMEMILNNRMLTADEALRLGLVNRVVSADRCLEQAIALAQEIAARSPLAVRAAKKMINQAYESALTEGLERERQTFFELFASEDRREGMQAFIEKRAPRWGGK